MPTPLLDLLRLALDSHRVAIGIDQDNADLLLYECHLLVVSRFLFLTFDSNTAQVLTSLAEATSEGRGATQTNQDEALQLFREGLELFERCLGLQEFQLTEQASVRAEKSAEADGENVDMSRGNETETSEGEQWTALVEPVTKDALVDTVLAQMETLTAICTLVSSEMFSDFAWVDEYYRSILRDKIAVYVDGTERHHEAALTTAKFMCTLLDAGFRGGQLDATTYERELVAAFNQDVDLSNDPHGLCDKADAEITFITSVQAALQENLRTDPDNLSQLYTLSWKHLSIALNNLATASTIPVVQNLPGVHLRRGDCELLRYRLAETPASFDVAIKSAATLIKNAEIYYRGSARLARNEGAVDEELEASVKEAIAASIAGNAGKLSELLSGQTEAVPEIIEDMRDEGLLSKESVALIRNFLG